MRMFFVFTTILLTASLASPAGAVPAGSSPWLQLMVAAGDRYWFFPTLALAWSLLWFANQPNRGLRKAAIATLFLTSFGVVRDWSKPKVQDNNFKHHAQLFDDAAPGTTVTIPLIPEGWNMQLVKHPGNESTK